MMIQICDDKRITVYKGDIQSFKMDMRSQMGISGQQKGLLRGDASTKKQEVKNKAESGPGSTDSKKPVAAKPAPKKVVRKKVSNEPKPTKADTTDDAWGSDDDAKKSSLGDTSSLKDSLPKPGASAPPKSGYVPPHLRNKTERGASAPPKSGYVPPHLRNKTEGGVSAPPKSGYVPPHLRNKTEGEAPAASASRYTPPHLRNRQ